MKEFGKRYEWNRLYQTSKGEVVVISSNSNDVRSIDIVLTNLCSRNAIYCCKLGATAGENGHVLRLLRKAGINENIDPHNMTTISDIQCSEKNKGYGSAMLTYFIKQARKQGIKVIGGWLSPVLPDREHHKELERFYKRLQFDVYFLPEGKEGVIIRRI